MPFLSMVRRALVETRSLLQRFSRATQKRRSCRFGMRRRRVLFMACETLFPVVVRLPVTWHTRAITHLVEFDWTPLGQGSGGPARPRDAAGARCGKTSARWAVLEPAVRNRASGGPPGRPCDGWTQRAGHCGRGRAGAQAGGGGKAGTGNRERQVCRCLPFDPS